MGRRWSNPWRISDEQCSGEWPFDQDKVYGGFLRENQSEMQDWPGEQKIVQEILKEDEQKKEKLHEQEVQQEEENRQSS